MEDTTASKQVPAVMVELAKEVVLLVTGVALVEVAMSVSTVLVARFVVRTHWIVVVAAAISE